MKFFEICAEVLVPKFTRAELRLPGLGLISLILMKLNKALIFKSGSIKSSDTVTITEEESGKC